MRWLPATPGTTAPRKRSRPFPFLALVLPALVISACSTGGSAPAAQKSPQPVQQRTAGGRLVTAKAAIDTWQQLPMDPTKAKLPPKLASQILDGYRIFMDTPKYAPEYVHNDMSCTNCHMNGGQKDKAIPLVGVAAAFPDVSGNSGRVISLEDRIVSCFLRSENGANAPKRATADSEPVIAVATYLSWISHGLPVGESPAWRHQNVIPRERQIPVDRLDPKLGQKLYAEKCAACHGRDGQGVEMAAGLKPGPLWGPGSWNDGAGLARVYTLAGFIRYAMPYSEPGSLSDEEAQQIAAFIDAQPRPSFPNKAKDYTFPGGKVPRDAVYYPQLYPQNPLALKLQAP
ncbi:MAG: c-type cytochrome [Bacillota bacterium]|nr:c-type cytochrome [Limnochordaceae bacterium]MDI3316815.1 c-type cytochrome [Bacillota bacterium]